jgi:hypothetical protein
MEFAAPPSEGAQFEERRILIDEQFDALARGELAALAVPGQLLRSAARDRLGEFGFHLGELGGHGLGGRRVFRRSGIKDGA